MTNSNIESMVNFNHLRSLLGGNEQQVTEMVGLIREHLPIAIKELRAQFEQNEIEKMIATVHGMKSYLVYLGNNELYEKVLNWESHLKSNSTFDHEEMISELELKGEPIVKELSDIH